MPNATISIYLTDEEYIKYVNGKDHINSKVKDLVKEEVKVVRARVKEPAKEKPNDAAM